MLRLLENLLPVQATERRLTFTLFLHSLFAVGAFLTGRTARDALFLAHSDRSSLPWMYVASALAVSFTGLLYGRLVARVRRDAMALATALAFAAVFVVAWLVERRHDAWLYPAIYVLVEVMGGLVLVQFWTLANELFNAREAKRLYGFIGAGGTVSNILVGLLAARVATAFGTSSLLLLCAALLVVTAGASLLGGHLGRQRLVARAATGKSGGQRTGGGARVLGDAHLRTVAVLAAVTFFTTTFVDYQFKVVAASRLQGDALAAYFGYFSAVVGALAIGMQLFGTSRLLSRVGVIGALAVLPVSLAVGDLALAVAGTLWAASLAKGADTLFRYSVNDATTQILYLPVAAPVRVAAKAFVDGVVKPVAVGLSGLFLVGYRDVGGADPTRLAWLTLVLALGWTAVVVTMRSKYLKSLQDNLRHRRLDLDSARHRVIDSNTSRVLARALGSTDEQEVASALTLLPQLDQSTLDPTVERLLDHPSAEIRGKALAYFGQRPSLRYANAAFRRFEDPDPAVRAAAIDAFCAMGRDKAVRSVQPYLDDPDPRVRAAAVTGMIRFGGLDGVLMAAEALKALIAHRDPTMRLTAARVLGAIGVKNFYQPVLQLMNDEELTVRRQAIAAAGLLRGPELVLPLIYRTRSADTVQEAVSALTAYGPGIVPTLAKALANRLEDAAIRKAAARVLGRLGTSEAVEVIARHLDEPDEDLRGSLYRSLARAVKGKRLLLKDLEPVRAALDAELDRAWRALQHAEALQLSAGPTRQTARQGLEAARALLASALGEKVQQVEHRAFLLLAVLFPDADMEQISAGLTDAPAADAARRRANAVELLDNLLDRHLKHRFLPLLEDLPRSERLRLVRASYAPVALAPAEVLRRLAEDEAAWVRACALWCVAEAEHPLREELLSRSVGDPSPLVREIALAALFAHLPATGARLAATRLEDEAAFVRARAAAIHRTAAARCPAAGEVAPSSRPGRPEHPAADHQEEHP